jgi:hypothetical protein
VHSRWSPHRGRPAAGVGAREEVAAALDSGGGGRRGSEGSGRPSMAGGPRGGGRKASGARVHVVGLDELLLGLRWIIVHLLIILVKIYMIFVVLPLAVLHCDIGL